MKRRAKELQQAKKEAKKGFKSYGGGYGGGISSQDYGHGSYMPTAETQSYEPTPKSSQSKWVWSTYCYKIIAFYILSSGIRQYCVPLVTVL